MIPAPDAFELGFQFDAVANGTASVRAGGPRSVQIQVEERSPSIVRTRYVVRQLCRAR